MLTNCLDQAIKQLLFEFFLALSEIAMLAPGAENSENGRILDFELEGECFLGVYDPTSSFSHVAIALDTGWTGQWV